MELSLTEDQALIQDMALQNRARKFAQFELAPVAEKLDQHGARDLAKLGIRIMTIAPGIFDTPMMKAQQLPERRRDSPGWRDPDGTQVTPR